MNIVIVGGGASGVFAALRCRENNKTANITLLEKSDRLLEKVRVSGGGRCNLSHACHDLAEFLKNYPRGRHFLRAAFHRFGPDAAVAWFNTHGVATVIEPDGRIFPATGRSATVIDCLVAGLGRADIAVKYCSSVQAVRADENGSGFSVEVDNGEAFRCRQCCIAVGGNRSGIGTSLVESPGHRVIEPVPSLFTFAVADARIAAIPGITVADVTVALPKTRFSERGGLLITHRGLSGPAVLRLSSFAARYLHGLDYRTTCTVNWCPDIPHREILERVALSRSREARSFVCDRTPVPLPIRLWESLSRAAGCAAGQRWADVSKQQANAIAQQVHESEFTIAGMDMNKSEFVTCGGIDLHGVDPQTMESRLQTGLFFCGETLDIDGITGGFNLQAAWSTGWIAGDTMGGRRSV